MIKVGQYEIGREEISIGLMILFALFAMFFLGYKLAYTQAITYANEQLIELSEELSPKYEIIKGEVPTEFVLELPEDMKDGRS